MKTLVFVLSVLFLSLPAFGGEPAPTTTGQVIERALLQPLAAHDDHRSRFARVVQPPTQRTARVLDTQPKKDSQGGAFVTFAVDEVRGRAKVVTKDVLTGCVYPATGELFVKRGDVYYPAAFLVGKTKDKAPSHVCTSPTLALTL